MSWFCGCLDAISTEPSETNDTKEPVKTVMRLSTASDRLLRQIPFVDGSYKCDDYSLKFIDDVKYGRKFTIDHVNEHLVWERESNLEIFGIRDRALAKLIDFSIATEDLLCEFAISLVVRGWHQTLKQLILHHPWVPEKIMPFLEQAFIVTRRHSLLTIFQDDITSQSITTPSSPPSLAPLSPQIEGQVRPSLLNVLAQSPPSSPPPYEEPQTTVEVLVHTPKQDVKEMQKIAKELFRRSSVSSLEDQSSFVASPRAIAREIGRPPRVVLFS